MIETLWLHIPYEYKKVLKNWQKYCDYETEDINLGKCMAFKFINDKNEFTCFMKFVQDESIEYKIFRREYNFSQEEKNNADILILKIDEKAKDSNILGESEETCNMCRNKIPLGMNYQFQVKPSNIKKSDISVTYNGPEEIVVSKKVKDLFERENISGINFAPVYELCKRREVINEYYQLQIVEGIGEVVPPSIIEGGELCRNCGYHTKFLIKGLLYFKKETWKGLDICYTKDWFGSRLKNRLIIISPRLYKILADNNIESFDVEPAYFIE